MEYQNKGVRENSLEYRKKSHKNYQKKLIFREVPVFLKKYMF